MKTIEQLLFLSKNPHFRLSPEEEKRLNDFLEEKQAKRSNERKKSTKKTTKKSAKKSSKKSDEDTLATADGKNHGSDTVRVRNVVPKTIPRVEESGQ